MSVVDEPTIIKIYELWGKMWKNVKIMLVFPNCARNYASTICQALVAQNMETA